MGWLKSENLYGYIKELRDIIIYQKVCVFKEEMKKRNLYTQRWISGYKEFLETKFGNNDEDFKQMLMSNDFKRELEELINFLPWYDENIAEKDSERYILKYGDGDEDV